jgi:ferrous-iron efflux pump FieF
MTIATAMARPKRSAALFQVALITASAAAIGWRALIRLGEDQPTANAELGIAVSLIAIAVTFALLAYQRRIIAQTGSVAIRADSIHYQSDLLLNLAVAAALLLDQIAGLTGADPVLGIAIALWLAWGAFKASSQAIDQLMDKEWPEEKRRRFLDAGRAPPAAQGHSRFPDPPQRLTRFRPVPHVCRARHDGGRGAPCNG